LYAEIYQPDYCSVMRFLYFKHLELQLSCCQSFFTKWCTIG